MTLTTIQDSCFLVLFLSHLISKRTLLAQLHTTVWSPEPGWEHWAPLMEKKDLNINLSYTTCTLSICYNFDIYWIKAEQLYSSAHACTYWETRSWSASKKVSMDAKSQICHGSVGGRSNAVCWSQQSWHEEQSKNDWVVILLILPLIILLSSDAVSHMSNDSIFI